jgi:ComF family protein
MFDTIQKLTGSFLHAIFPYICISCKKEGAFLCEECFSKIKKYGNPVFEKDFKIIIPCPYHKNRVLAQAIHRMKYTFYKDLSKPLAELFIETLQKFPLPRNTHIVPIPLHKKRERFRGFNQSRLLANHIGEKCKFPVIDLLIRVKQTKSQAKLCREERLQNLKNAFSLNPTIESPSKNTPLLIIDDICTTFTTLTQAAKTLQKNGFDVVFGAAIAHAEKL